MSRHNIAIILNAILILSLFPLLISCDTTVADKGNDLDKFKDNITGEIGTGVLCIFQDKRGNYWFGSQSSGAYRYDGKYLIQFTTKDGLFQNQIEGIQEDASGNIWFLTGGYGINKFDGEKITTIRNEPERRLDAGPDKGWQLEGGDLWFNAGGGVYRYKSSLAYLPFFNFGNSFGYKPGRADEVSAYGVYAILKDSNGSLWMGTQAMGVCRYDGKNFTWLTEKGLAGPAVLVIFEDKNGKLWFGNNGRGLFCFDGKSLTNLTEEKGLGNPGFIKSGEQAPGTLARVWAINEDNYGKLLIGTGEGEVWAYDGGDLTRYTVADGLPGSPIECIYKDRKGIVWIGTNGDGVYKFSGTSFKKFNPSAKE